MLENKHHKDVKFKQRDANLKWFLIHLSKVNYFLTAYHTVNINSYKPEKKRNIQSSLENCRKKANISWNFMFRYFHPQKSQKWIREDIHDITDIYKSYSYYIMLKFKGEINVRSKPI